MVSTKEKHLFQDKEIINKSGDIRTFIIKAVIVLLIIMALSNILLPDMKGLNALNTPKAKLILLSFVQNPRALIRMSEIDESNGKIENAIREVDMAIGLLEMYGSDKSVVKEYQVRLQKLKLLDKHNQ